MNRFKDADTVAEVVGQAIGFGSVCWENPGGAGVFDSAMASEAVDDAVERINEIIGILSPAQAQRLLHDQFSRGGETR